MSANRAFWRRRAPWVVGAGLLALAQAMVIGWMIWDRAQILTQGREIVLKPEPVDPRDLFRGDYVILSYAISRSPEGADFDQGAQVWVKLAQTDDGAWRVRGVSEERPGQTPDEVILRASADRRGSLNYGLERFYVPQGEGLRIEEIMREGRGQAGDEDADQGASDRLEVVVAVAPDGRAAIKGLRVDGEPAFEEPLF